MVEFLLGGKPHPAYYIPCSDCSKDFIPQDPDQVLCADCAAVAIFRETGECPDCHGDGLVETATDVISCPTCTKKSRELLEQLTA